MNKKNLTAHDVHQEFGEMTWLLMNDVLRSWRELHKATTKEDQDFWKRNFTRSVFAQIEGFAESFRFEAFAVELNKLISKISSGEEVSLDMGMLSALAGKSFMITNDGEMKPQTTRTAFLPNLLFCFKRFAEARGVHVQIKKGDKWSKIESAVRVRDRLMHPKNPESLDIGEREIGDVVFTLKWFYKQLHSIQKLERQGEELKDFPDEIFTLKLKKL